MRALETEEPGTRGLRPGSLPDGGSGAIGDGGRLAPWLPYLRPVARATGKKEALIDPMRAMAGC